MTGFRTGWVLGLVGVFSAVPVLAQGGGGGVPSAHFRLRVGARIVTHVAGQAPDTLAGFVGRGGAVATDRNLDLRLDQLEQRAGTGTLDVAPSGPLKRLRRSRVFVGRGTASATVRGEQADFNHVRFAAHVRGRADRVRLLGIFHGRDVPAAAGTPRAALLGRFHGQMIEPTAAP